MAIKNVKERNNDTITLNLGDDNSIEVRTYLDGLTKEALVEDVVNHVVDEHGYHPSRKDAFMTLAFIYGFVTESDARNLVVPNGDGVDVYATAELVDRLNIREKLITSMSGKSDDVVDMLSKMSEEVDAKVDYVIQRQNAILASGVAKFDQFAEQLQQAVGDIQAIGNVKKLVPTPGQVKEQKKAAARKAAAKKTTK